MDVAERTVFDFAGALAVFGAGRGAEVAVGFGCHCDSWVIDEGGGSELS